MNQDKELKEKGIIRFYFPGYWEGKVNTTAGEREIITTLIISLAEDLN